MSANTLSAYFNDIGSWLSQEYTCHRKEEGKEGKTDQDHSPEAEEQQLLLFLKGVTAREARKSVLKMTQNGLKPQSIQRRLAALRTFYTFLLKLQLVDHDPFHTVQAPKGNKPLPPFINAASLSKLINTLYDLCENEVNAEVKSKLWEEAFVLDFLFQTGLRSTELITLTVADINLPQKEIRVLGKGNKMRIVPFGERLKQKITEHLETYRVSTPESKNLLTTQKGKPLARKTLYLIVHNALQPLVQYSKKSPHILRHSFATALLNNGASLLGVKELLGHESTATTSLYTHTTFEEIKRNYTAHPRARKIKKSNDTE